MHPGGSESWPGGVPVRDPALSALCPAPSARRPVRHAGRTLPDLHLTHRRPAERGGIGSSTSGRGLTPDRNGYDQTTSVKGTAVSSESRAAAVSLARSGDDDHEAGRHSYRPYVEVGLLVVVVLLTLAVNRLARRLPPGDDDDVQAARLFLLARGLRNAAIAGLLAAGAEDEWAGTEVTVWVLVAAALALGVSQIRLAVLAGQHKQ